MFCTEFCRILLRYYLTLITLALYTTRLPSWHSAPAIRKLSPSMRHRVMKTISLPRLIRPIEGPKRNPSSWNKGLAFVAERRGRWVNLFVLRETENPVVSADCIWFMRAGEFHGCLISDLPNPKHSHVLGEWEVNRTSHSESQMDEWSETIALN